MDKNTFLNARPAKDQVGLFYLGQEGFLIKYENTYLLVDPYLSDFVDRRNSTPEAKWERRYPAPVSADVFDFVDYIFCTHNHNDHSDPDTLKVLAKINTKAKFIAPPAVREKFLSCGISEERIVDAVADVSIYLGACSVVPVPSAHEELHMDKNGNYEELGYKFQLGSISLYHAGDCCVYEGLAERIMGVDVLMVPVNGRSYYKRYEQNIIGNMTSEEAVILAKQVHAGMIVPMHYDMYDINRINPAEFVDCLFSMNQAQKFHMFAPGEYYIVQK